MMLIEMSSYLSAKQKYKKSVNVVDSFAQRDLSQNKRYVKKMCDLYFEEHIPFEEICRMFSVYEEHKGILDSCGVNFNELSYEQLKDLIYHINGEHSDIQELPNTIYKTSDGLITVGYITSFDEALNLECDNSWCIATSQGRWDEHKHLGETFYIIRCLLLSKSTKCRFVMAQVNPNGEIVLWNSDNEKLQTEHQGNIPSVNEYLTAIGDARKVLVPRNTPSIGFGYLYNFFQGLWFIKSTGTDNL
jgi:hypothetical protein